MNPALRDFRLLWQMAVSARNQHSAKLVTSTILALAFVGALIYLVESRDVLLALGVGVRIALAGLTLVTVMSFLPGAARLNTPAHAHLVPRMRRRLMQLTAGVWVAATGVMTLVALDTRLPASFVFLMTGSFIAIQALGFSGHRAGGYLQVAVTASLVAGGGGWLVEALDGVTSGWLFAAATCLMFAFGAYVLRTMFMTRGDRHYALRERRRLQVELLSPQGQLKKGKLRTLSSSLYEKALRRDCARRDPRKLLAHLLGATEHWTGQLASLAILVVPLAGAMLVVRHYGGDMLRAKLANYGWVFAAAFLFTPFAELQRRNRCLMNTVGEQALLRLAPVLPGSPAPFNRSVSRMLLGSSARNWCCMVVAVMCLTLASGATSSSVITQLCLCCLTLPLIGFNLRNQARLSSMLGSSVLVFLLTSAGVSLLAGIILRAATGLPAMPGAALMSIVIAYVDVSRRWRRSVDAPFAFPVGRLAGP